MFDPNKAGISAAERVDFYSFLISLLENGGSLQEASEKVARVLKDQSKQAKFGKAKIQKAGQLYEYVSRSLRESKPLHVALKGRIPDAEAMLLLAGARGDLIDGLKAAASQAKASAEMRQTLIKGILYPIALFIALVYAAYWIGNNLFPTLEMLKPLATWTDGQRKVHWFTTSVGVWVPILLSLFIGLAVVVVLINRRVIGPAREYVDYLPPFTLIRRMTGASFLTTISSLIMAGDKTKEALDRIYNTTSSPYLRVSIRKILNNMRSGAASKSPGRAMAVPLFTPWIVVKLDIYGQGSITDFAKHMELIASDARQEAMGSINTISRLLNIIMLIAVGVMIGATVITMYTITGSMKVS